VRNLISSGKIKDILQLKEGFYEELKEGLEEEEEFEDEPSCPEELIIQLMSNRFQSCSEESMKMNEILEKVGFDSQFAEDFANHIEADPLDMSLWDWIHHFVVSTLDHLWMKRSDGKTYESKQAVAASSSTDSTSQQNQNSIKQDIGNYLSDEDFPENVLKTMTENNQRKNLEGIESWFHGTSPTYAAHITKKGIDLKMGKKKANYSHNDGFYLTDNLDLAMRAAFQKYCIPNYNNKGETLDEIAVIVFQFKTEDIEDYERIDKRPTLEELTKNKLEAKKEACLRKIVYFFSNGAVMEPDLDMTDAEKRAWEAKFEKDNGLKHDYKEKIQFIVGPYTSFEGQGKKRVKENIQIPDLTLIQLCLRREEIKTIFQKKFMNKVWLSLKIPRGYSEIIKQNQAKESERGRRNNLITQMLIETAFVDNKTEEDLRNYLHEKIELLKIVQQRDEFLTKLTEIVEKIKAEPEKWEEKLKVLLHEKGVEQNNINTTTPLLIEDIKTALKFIWKYDKKKNFQKSLEKKIKGPLKRNLRGHEDEFKKEMNEIFDSCEKNFTKGIEDLLQEATILFFPSENVKKYTKKFSRPILVEYIKGKTG
jgi:hypothetical protein